MIIGTSVIASVTDFIQGKVYNWLTLSSMSLALLYHSLIHPFFYHAQGASSFSLNAMAAGFGFSFLGILASLLFLGWMYGVRQMGAGDVKLLMCFGAWGGWKYSLYVSLLSIFLGAALALILLTLKGKIGQTLQKAYRTLLSLMLKELQFEKPKIDPTLTMPYAIPLSVAAVWVAFQNPLVDVFPLLDHITGVWEHL
jgi:Flp pilus assembly protein protease CpaA